MAHDVFVCHPSEERTTAMAVVATLEADRVRCWIAPRDVLPSEDWAKAIVQAIKSSRLFVLVFSEHSNRSKHVMREVEQAVSRGIPILPFRIDDVEPNPTLEYFIGGTHWLDALTPPLEAHLHRLAETVRVLLPKTAEPPAVDETGTTAPERPIEPPEVAHDQPAGSDAEPEPPMTDDWDIEVQPLTDEQVKSLLDSKEQAVFTAPNGFPAGPVDDADEEDGQVAAAVPPPAGPPPEPPAVPPAAPADLRAAGPPQPPPPEERIDDLEREERRRRGPLLAVGAAAILIAGVLGILGLTRLLGNDDTEVLDASVTTAATIDLDDSSIPALDSTTTTSTSPPTTTTSSAPPSTTTTTSTTTKTAPPATTAPKPTTPTTVAVTLVARNDSYTKDDRSQTCFDVTANDSGSAPLTVVSVGGSEFGSASAASCGVVYSPPDFDTRPDAFVDVISYTVKDATGATASATLTVSVR